MMFFYIIFLFSFLFDYIQNNILEAILTKKLNNKLKNPDFISNHKLIYNDKIIYESNLNGIHLILLENNEYNNITSEIINPIDSDCKDKIITNIKIPNKIIIILSLFNWESCINDNIIKEIPFSNEKKLGTNHALILTFFNYKFDLQISHQSNFLGKFNHSINIDTFDQIFRFKNKNSLHQIEKNNNKNNITDEILVELISYGENIKENEFSLIKINNKLIHASHSCGLHIALFDQCKNNNDNEKNIQIQEENKKLINKITNEINQIVEFQLFHIEIDCFQNLKNSKIISNLLIFSQNLDIDINLYQEFQILISCPSNCFNQKLIKFDLNRDYFDENEIICESAIKKKIINNQGGTFLMKIKIDLIENSYPIIDINEYISNNAKSIKYFIYPYRLLNLKPDNFSLERNETDFQNIHTNLIGIIKKSLYEAEKISFVSKEILIKLKSLYNFKQDLISFVSKSINKYFPENQDLAIELKNYIKQEKYNLLLKKIRKYPIFPLQLDNDYTEKKKIEENLLFSKTYNICPSEELTDFNEKELFELKNLLENVSEEMRILLVTSGKWIGGLDNPLCDRLKELGAPIELSKYFHDFQWDASKSNVILAFTGMKNIGSGNGFGEIIQNLNDNSNFLNIDKISKKSDKIEKKFDLNKIFPCNPANELFSKEIKIDKIDFDLDFKEDCDQWSCRFFYQISKNIEDLVNNLLSIDKSSKTYLNNFLINLSNSLSNSNLLIKIEQLKKFPINLFQFLFDPILLFPEIKSSDSCNLILQSSNTESSFIKYGLNTFTLEKNNSILIVIFDNTCEHKFLKSEIFDSSLENLEKLNIFLQEIDQNNILSFVQKGFFNWSLIIETSLIRLFEIFGLENFENSNQNLFSLNNFVFLGKKNPVFKNSLNQISYNTNSKIEINLCEDVIFKKCETNFLYIRSEGLINSINSPVNMRIIALKGEIITENKEKGLTLTILGCDSSENTNNNYKKFYEKNFDMWSDGNLISDLNVKLVEFIEKDYFGIPIFIISSYGNYELDFQAQNLDFKLNDKFNDWKIFSKLIEKLGGDIFIDYLLRENKIFDNGREINIGHPFIFIGSTKFKKYEAKEYKINNFENNLENNYQNNLIHENNFDLNEKKLFCPKNFNEHFKLFKLKNNKNIEKKLDIIKNIDVDVYADVFADDIYSFKQKKTENNETKDESSDEFVYNITKDFIKNRTNSSLDNTTINFPFIENNNPCLVPYSENIISNESKRVEFNEIEKNLTDAIKIIIRGLILGNSSDSITNILIEENEICNTKIELDNELDEFNYSKKIKMKINRYYCYSIKSINDGSYPITLLTKSDRKICDIQGYFQTINEIAQELIVMS